MNFCTVTKLFLHFSTVYERKSSVEDSAECFPAQIHGTFRPVPCPAKSNLLFSQLRIYCADRTKTHRAEASGPSRSDWNGRMPLLFCRRLKARTSPSPASVTTPAATSALTPIPTSTIPAAHRIACCQYAVQTISFRSHIPISVRKPNRIAAAASGSGSVRLPAVAGSISQ